MKKIILKIILVIGIVLVIKTLFSYYMCNKMWNSIVDFQKQKDRYYSVINKNIADNYRVDSIFVKGNVVKYTNKINEQYTYCEWKNFSAAEEYSIDLKNKKFSQSKSSIENREFLVNMPNLISILDKEEGVKISKIFEIRSIIPIKYNEQFCYKISTKTEVIIIDAKTYLPVYSNVKTVNSDLQIDNKTGNFYEFKIGEVKEEDMVMPDITGFEEIKK